MLSCNQHYCCWGETKLELNSTFRMLSHFHPSMSKRIRSIKALPGSRHGPPAVFFLMGFGTRISIDWYWFVHKKCIYLKIWWLMIIFPFQWPYIGYSWRKQTFAIFSRQRPPDFAAGGTREPEATTRFERFGRWRILAGDHCHCHCPKSGFWMFLTNKIKHEFTIKKKGGKAMARRSMFCFVWWFDVIIMYIGCIDVYGWLEYQCIWPYYIQ